MTRRTVTRLADGRDLVYYDDDDAPRRRCADRRPLGPREGGSELRHDPLRGEWVAVATHRQSRTFLPSSDACPLCSSVEGRLTEVPSPSYDVAVFENRWPSFTELATGGSALAGSGHPSLPARHHGVGRCEVVCFTDDHHAAFARLPPTRVRTIIDAWADRTTVLSARPDVATVAIFENRGEEIGVTLHHPHGQVYAYPFVPPVLGQMLANARAYRERTGRDLFAELLAHEQDADRVVTESPGWVAFVPFAARWPFEVHVYPRRRVPDLTALNDEERAELATLLPDVLSRFDGLFDMPMPYVAAWYQSPSRLRLPDSVWLHLQISSNRRAPDKLKHPAGSETAFGAFVNDVRPEHAAALLREARP